jgi:signal transduction histidine kinase
MRAAVTLARRVEFLVPHLPASLAPGYHRIAGFDLEVPAEGPVTVALGHEVGVPARHVAIDPLDDEVSLWFSKDWSGRPRPQDRVLWVERREVPLAGHWAFTYRGSMHWWQAARFRTWVPPGMAAFLLLLAIPAALQFALRKRRRLDEARARFINELAHDLRTPLTSLRLHAEMLGSGRSPEEKRPQYVGLIEREALRLTSLLSNLLDLSRLEGTRAALQPESLPVAVAVEQALGAFLAVHPERRGDVSVAGGEEVTVRADAAALGRVLGNLLENAGKFTKPGTAVRVAWARVRGAVQLTVADDGPGIPAEERRRIFERYARGAAAKRDGVAGSGLGLALVRELLTRMDGSIKLQPTAGGTTFQLRLPEGEHA